jgi:hypothetical protein
VQFGPMLRRERHLGEHIGLGLVQAAAASSWANAMAMKAKPRAVRSCRRAPARCALSARGNAANWR